MWPADHMFDMPAINKLINFTQFGIISFRGIKFGITCLFMYIFVSDDHLIVT